MQSSWKILHFVPLCRKDYLHNFSIHFFIFPFLPHNFLYNQTEVVMYPKISSFLLRNRVENQLQYQKCIFIASTLLVLPQVNKTLYSIICCIDVPESYIYGNPMFSHEFRDDVWSFLTKKPTAYIIQIHNMFLSNDFRKT